MKQQIVLASNNQGKIKEFNELFNQLDIEIIPQSEFNIPETDEPFNTFIENSLQKARHCAKLTGLPSLADDSGLCVKALNGAPGVHSAYYAGLPKNIAANNALLIKNLQGSEQRDAYFYCCLVLVKHVDDPQPIISDGWVAGTIIDIPHGDNGFGYDPYFYLPQYNKTFAELDTSIKNSISHRAMALQSLLAKLKG